MRAILTLLCAAMLLAQTGKQKLRDKYDPDSLPPGEIGCGRPSSRKSPPCTCVRHRLDAVEKAREQCMLILDKTRRMDCMRNAPACEDVRVIDQEHAYENEGTMPPQCKRSCTKGRCECCHS